MFQGNRRSAASIQQRARLQVEERLLVDSSLGGSGPPPARWICWSPPPTNVIKLNFDAAVRGEGFSTVACVARDETSKLILAAGFLCDHGTVMEAEMRRMWEALRLCQLHLSDKALWVEGDALEVIEALHGTSRAQEPSILLVEAW